MKHSTQPKPATELVRDALQQFAEANGVELGQVILWDDQPTDLPVVDRCRRYDH